MSPSTFAPLLALLGALWLLHRLCCDTRQKNGRKLPPGPPALPIIGNLHMLGSLPHRALQNLAKKYGPIMSMRLGNVPAIIISSPEEAELVLRTHDAVFASRPRVQASEYISYGSKGMALTEYGPYWRSVRKLCTLELLTAAKIESFAGMRREEVGLLVEELRQAATEGAAVDVSQRVEELSEDITCRMVFGRKHDERFDLKAIAHEVSSLAGAFNLADYVPLLRPLDLQGLTRRFKAIMKDIDDVMKIIMDDHEQVQVGQQSHLNDFLSLLLSLMNKSTSSTTHQELAYSIDRTNIKAILLDMIIAAIETSTSAIIWSLSELIRHPRVMKKLQEELKNAIGKYRMVEETDLSMMEYLDMVIKETLRLHPILPLLVPRESMEDIEVKGYFIPKRSRIIVNAWALGHDPNVWLDNVEEFIPERFIESNINFKGQYFQFLPFGSDRRGCPRMQLGLTSVRLLVAQVVHCFNWELPHGMSLSDMDMSERFGLSMSRAKHLIAIPSYRLHA